MPKLWSELPTARAWELAADAGTILWLALWSVIGWRLHAFLAQFAVAGRTIRAGGAGLEAAGERIGQVLMRVPVIGQVAGEGIRDALAATGEPFTAVGGDLERFLLAIAALLALIVLTVPAALWLERYLPWRVKRVRMVQAAHRAIRVTPHLANREMERLLAARAFHRLAYEDLLRFSPDPFGDWAEGRYERLARAELASVGLRPI